MKAKHCYPSIKKGVGIGKQVELTATISYGNYGIGSYEFWGEKCNDVRMGYELQEITWDEKLYSIRENEIIQQFIEDNDLSDDFEKALKNE